MAAVNQGAQEAPRPLNSFCNSFWSFWSFRASCCPGLPARRSALGFSSTCTLMLSTVWYSFSSGVLPHAGLKELLQLMARSPEMVENELSRWDTSSPGLLSSRILLLALRSGWGKLPPVTARVGTGDAGVSSVGL